MLHWIIQSSARFRLLILALAVALLVVGIARLPGTSVEVLPDFGPVRVEVQTEALGLAPEEVENLITNPMEQEFFNGMPWLHKIRSISATGLSAVQMFFDPGTDDVKARQVVQERLTMVTALPHVSKPPFVIQPTATTGRLMLIGLTSDQMSLVDLSVLARWKIQQRLLSVPGVANVAIWGLRNRQLQVLIDPHRLRLYNLDVDDVVRTAANSMWSSPLTYVEASTPGTGGFIDTAHQRISINHTQPIKTANQLAQVAIESDHFVPITLGDVAEVVEGHPLLIGDAVVDGGKGLLMVVERFPNTSIAEVTRNVEHALDAMRPGLTGINIDTSVFRAVSFVEAARANLAGSLGVGFALLVLVLVAFIVNWRVTLISAVAVLVSFAAAWLALSAYGAMLNMMIVAGLVLALAVVVDDAIVCTDNIKRYLAENAHREVRTSVMHTIVAAMREMAAPLATALAIIVASVLPVFALGPDSGGDFVKPLLLTYALVVLISMVVALTVTPALSVVLLSRVSDMKRETRLVRVLADAYARFIRRCVQYPRAVLAIAVVLVVGGVAVLPQITGVDLIPVLKDRDVVVRVQSVPGSSLPAMRRVVAAASEEIRDIPGVLRVGAHIGRATNSDLVADVDTAQLWISMHPDADYERTFDAIKKKMSSHPGVQTDMGAYSNLRVQDVARDTHNDLVVRVYGRDYDVLQQKAKTVSDAIAEIPGVQTPHIVLPKMEPAVEVQVNVTRASLKGIKPGDARRAAATVLSSITAGTLYEEQKIFDVVVWGGANKRDSLMSIQNALIDAPNHNQVRLMDVADVRVRPNPSLIEHDAVSRYLDVTAQVRTSASLGRVTRDAEAHMKQISFPAEHHVEVLGDATQRLQARNTLLLYSLAALITVFFILQARFESWRLAILLFGSLLLPLAGMALGAATQGHALSGLALLAGFASVAVAIRGGLLLIERYRSLEQMSGNGIDPELVVAGARDRFSAVVLSSAGSALTLLPLLVYGTVAGLEVVKPLAAGVMGGLLGAALLNLVVLPVLYLKVARPLSVELRDHRDEVLHYSPPLP